MYCEQCGTEDLDHWEELPDGTVVCSPKCAYLWYRDTLGRDIDKIPKEWRYVDLEED